MKPPPITGMRTFTLVCLLLGLPFILGNAVAQAVDTHPLVLRQEYNAVSAQIDSLVRMMAAVDPKALDTNQLPEADDIPQIPDGMNVVCIFWADDEARIWLNDYLVGETRLTPVEIEIPPLYLKNNNQIRARCWDTDWVESGFLFGLYLKDTAGALHPILVSNDTWQADNRPALEITYAHPVPDIPGARVIWQTQVFGKVEFQRSFDHSIFKKIAKKAGRPSPPNTLQNRMDHHSLMQGLVVLQERRDEIKRLLQQQTQTTDLPAYTGPSQKSLSLTLGKAGPLNENITRPVAEQIKTWAEKLPEAQKRLIYPQQRILKGEDAANLAAGQTPPVSTQSGGRESAYRPPEERQTSSGSTKNKQDKKGPSVKGSADENETGSAGPTGGWSGGRAARLGLLLPTLILAAYIGFVIIRWNDLFSDH